MLLDFDLKLLLLLLSVCQVEIDKPVGLKLEQSTAKGGGLVVKVRTALLLLLQQCN
jgi:hypothetical protein